MARLFQIIAVATFVLFSTGLPITNNIESSDHLKSLMTGLRVFQQVFDNKIFSATIATHEYVCKVATDSKRILELADINQTESLSTVLIAEQQLQDICNWMVYQTQDNDTHLSCITGSSSVETVDKLCTQVSVYSNIKTTLQQTLSAILDKTNIDDVVSVDTETESQYAQNISQDLPGTIGAYILAPYSA